MITLIFPIAGPALENGKIYPPFRRIGEQTAIEAAFRSFKAVRRRISRIVFVCQASQEIEFNVGATLRRLFPSTDFDLVVIPLPTSGPFDTVAQVLRLRDIVGPGIICDCDHSLDLVPFFDRLFASPEVDCLIPVWNLRGEDLRSWSVAGIDDSAQVLSIAEKQLPNVAGRFVGVIGCTYFRDLGWISKNVRGVAKSYVSDAIRVCINAGKYVEAVMLEKAFFFGTPEGETENRSRYQPPNGTIFCDLDGTLIEHQDVTSYLLPVSVLPGSREKLQSWIQSGYHIVITTSRPATEEQELRCLLKQANLPYAQLVMGLPSGPRYVINDRKPSARFTRQAKAFEIERNKGIQQIELASASLLHVLKRFKGGSLAETLLLEDDQKKFIRKRVSKSGNLASGYGKLKQQYRALERFAQLVGGLVPALYCEHEDTLEYYYDLEYLPDHRPLTLATQEQQCTSLTALLQLLKKNIYSQRKPASEIGAEWLHEHITQKIYAKLDLLREHPLLRRLISGPEIIINGKSVMPIIKSLQLLTTNGGLKQFAPRFMTTVHGDLTFGNILICNTDIKLIDTDAILSPEAPELDLGKLFQSLIARYEEWEQLEGILVRELEGGRLETTVMLNTPSNELLNAILTEWSDILECPVEQAHNKGLFYMGLHLIRMVPYRMKVSESQANLALLYAAVYLSALAERQGDN